MTSPAPNATATGNTNVSATATDQSSSITGVQFLLDGGNLGAQVTSPPYSLTWNTTTTTAGTHTLSATVFDSAGLSASAAPITVTVDNSGNPAVVGSWSAPVTTPTVAVNLILLKNGNVLFFQDGTAPTVWNYSTNVFTTIATSVNLFCSGHALLSLFVRVVENYEMGDRIGYYARTNGPLVNQRPVGNSYAGQTSAVVYF